MRLYKASLVPNQKKPIRMMSLINSIQKSNNHKEKEKHLKLFISQIHIWTCTMRKEVLLTVDKITVAGQVPTGGSATKSSGLYGTRGYRCDTPPITL